MQYFSNSFDKVLEWQIHIACIQCWDTPDDGQWTCPKHVEYFIKYQIWEIVHLLGFHYKNDWGVSTVPSCPWSSVAGSLVLKHFNP